MSRFIDLTGKRFGKLLVLSRTFNNKSGHTLWLCKCDCGEEKAIYSGNLIKGLTRSCFGIYHRGPQRYLWNRYRSSARHKGRAFKLSIKQFYELVTKPCHYCGLLPCRKIPGRSSAWKEKGFSTRARFTSKAFNEFMYSGIDRVDSSIGYTPKNCVPCCTLCNIWKKALTKKQFLEHVRRIALYQEFFK